MPQMRAQNHKEDVTFLMNMPRRQRIASLMLKIFPLAMLSLIAVLIGKVFGRMTVEEVLHYTPENLFLAALCFIGAYTLKSLSLFFPLIVLYISSGITFPFPLSVLINWAGLVICVSVPYGVGRFVGTEWVNLLLSKHKKAQKLERFRSNNEWFLSYILRVVNLLPGDLVSLFLGASRTNYIKYLSGSLLGLSPTMLAVTLMGDAIRQPGSPQFLTSLFSTVLLSVLSIVIYRRFLRQKAE